MPTPMLGLGGFFSIGGGGGGFGAATRVRGLWLGVWGASSEILVGFRSLHPKPKSQKGMLNLHKALEFEA